MNAFADQNNPGLRPGDCVEGYSVLRVTELREINSFFYELKDTVTGAGHIHISNQDTENAFGITFRTVPSDSTGVAHILEHTVLCGSAKFPVRDPFFSMLKRSLSTFMNALTASDWTMYPFSTQNKKDFYNLMDVYLDAAFFPKIDRLSFKQEGHRLEIKDNELVFKGVVYNEMKGAMSSPDQILVRSLMNALYPSTTYSNNSGGDPAAIPNLTYEQLTEFHRRHYHPSNASFYTYGNLPLKDHLIFIRERILKNFSRIDPKTEVPSQPRWEKPKTVTYYYPLDRNEDPAKKCQVCVAWLMADTRDSFEVLTLDLLEHILLGNSASPLHKALIESGLGTALSDGTGFDPDNRDTLFACGLKDVEESAAEKIEAIIFDVLKTLADKGIDRELIESAIHQTEFHRKEITNTPYPYGIKLLLSFAGPWLHGGDPLKVLRFDEDLKRLDEERAKGPFFENRIRQYFLDNPHRVLFRLIPDQMMEQKEEERIRRELSQLKSAMSHDDLEQILNDAEALEELQETPEDLSLLPTLNISDIPPSVQAMAETDPEPFIRNLKTALPAGFRFPISVYRQPTSGIFYLSAAAGAGSLENRLLPLVPFFCFAFSKIATSRRDYSDMVRLIDAYTGGIGVSAHARNDFGGSGACLPFVTFNGKSLARNTGKLFEITEELICEFDFASDPEHLRRLLLRYRAGLESAIVHNGHGFALSLASRNFSAYRILNETWSGVHQLQAIKKLADELTDDNLSNLAKDLSCVGKTLFSRDNFKAALIGEEEALSLAFSSLTSLQNRLGQRDSGGFGPPKIRPGQELPREGWSTSSAVSFVAQTFETVRMEHEDSPALTAIAKLLQSLYLHREIREKGGAYGGFAMYNSEDGLFGFASYRDPHIVSTLKVYEKAGEFIMSGTYTDEDIKESILQVCSDIDRPDPPGPSAQKAFYRKLLSLSDESRKQFKQRLLGLTREQVVRVAEKYFDMSGKQQGIAVVSSEEKLKAANEEFSDHPLALHRI